MWSETHIIADKLGFAADLRFPGTEVMIQAPCMIVLYLEGDFLPSIQFPFGTRKYILPFSKGCQLDI